VSEHDPLANELLRALFEPQQRGRKPSILDEYAMATSDIGLHGSRTVVRSDQRQRQETPMDNVSSLRERLGSIDEQVARAHARKMREAEAEEQRLLRERDRLERRIGLLETYGDDDVWENGTIFQFTKNFASLPSGGTPRNSRTGSYNYVAIKVEDDCWFMTGSAHKDSLTWEALVTFFTNTPAIHPDDVYVVTQLVPFTSPELDGIEEADVAVLDARKVRVVSANGNTRNVSVVWPADWAIPLPSKTAAGGVRIALL